MTLYLSKCSLVFKWKGNYCAKDMAFHDHSAPPRQPNPTPQPSPQAGAAALALSSGCFLSLLLHLLYISGAQGLCSAWVSMVLYWLSVCLTWDALEETSCFSLSLGSQSVLIYPSRINSMNAVTHCRRGAFHLDRADGECLFCLTNQAWTGYKEAKSPQPEPKESESPK